MPRWTSAVAMTLSDTGPPTRQRYVRRRITALGGFEPPPTEPNSVVLPLHHRAPKGVFHAASAPTLFDAERITKRQRVDEGPWPPVGGPVPLKIYW